MSVAEVSEGLPLQVHVKQARGFTNETALISCIKNVLSSADCFVFGELLALDSIKSLSSKDGVGKQHYELLEIFAYGKYSDYKARRNDLPVLTDPQIKKLKQLTIVALANEVGHVISYKKLLEELDIDNLRDLCDLIISALYKNILVGKLDHEKQELQIEAAIGRDIRPQDLDRMISLLDRWEKQSETLMKSIEQKIETAKEANTRATRHKDDYEKKLEELKSTIKAAMENEMTGSVDPEFMSEYLLHEKGFGQQRRDKPKSRQGGPPRGRHMNMM